jgi:hypothetical protein
VPLGPAATGSSNPLWLGSNGSAVPSPAPQVAVDPGAFLPVPTATKVKSIFDSLDELAAALNG